MSMPTLITDRAITVSIGGRPHTVRSDAPTFPELYNAIRDRDWDAIPRLLSNTTAIEDFTNGHVEVLDGEVLYRGHPCHGTVVTKILELMKEGFDISPLTNFLARVENNPSIDARRELYDFCEANGFMIDVDGFLIAYKAVRNNYMDKHTGTMDNSIGTVVSMPREDVDADRTRTCSAGLHFAAAKYAFGFARRDDRVLVLRVDPADVVAIPSDYQNEKGRAWKYVVIDEITDGEALKDTTFSKDAFEVEVPTTGAGNMATAFITAIFDDDLLDDDDDLECDCRHCRSLNATAAALLSDSDDEDGTAEARRKVLNALDDSGWVVAGPNGAAAALGVAESTLRGRMTNLGITRSS